MVYMTSETDGRTNGRGHHLRHLLFFFLKNV